MQPSNHFSGIEGQLYWQAWLPSGVPRALLVIVHGFDDHIRRYAHVADFFAQRGFAVYGYDQIGHGESEGKRGHVAQFDHYIEDAKRFVAIAQTKTSDAPTFLIGHSMGGLVALRYGIMHPQGLSGIITSGAGLMLSLPVPGWKLFVSRVLSQLAPTFTLPNDIPAHLLTHDQTIVAMRANKQDRYTHYVASARWGAEFLAAQPDTLAQANRFTLPCLLLHGGADGIIHPDGSKRFHATCASADKTLKIYDSLYHEIFNELGKEQVLADVEAWLEKQLALYA